jgi:hypothetical protein
MRNRYELCKSHVNQPKIFYDHGLQCPLCEAEEKILELEKKIDDMEEAE